MKESEWIISPEKLKENHLRAIERDRNRIAIKKENKKNRITGILSGIILTAIVVLLVTSMKNMSDDFMEQCTTANSYSFCMRAMDGR